MVGLLRTLALCGLATAMATAAPANAQVYFGKAVAIDGDTLELGGQRIRLFGMDAVEASQNCDRDGEAWACGRDASLALGAMIEGHSIQCERRDIDRYGRIVAVCWRDGRDIGRAMVMMGFAVALPEFSQDYVGDERQAEARGAGIWGSNFELPKDFRANDPASIQRSLEMLAERKARDEAYEAAAARNSSRSSSWSYRNCREARAAGAAPLYRGEPGYGEHMDGDGDGIACEPYRGRR